MIKLLLSSVAVLICSSCAYTIPNGGQSVIADVTDLFTQPVVSSNGQLMSAAPTSSMNHAAARAQQANAFYGGAH